MNARRAVSHSARSAWIETHNTYNAKSRFGSHSARSAWIETSCRNVAISAGSCRTPQGVRGLKHHCFISFLLLVCRTPQGVRGLKLGRFVISHKPSGRTPQGVRGLKPGSGKTERRPGESHSARSAWIETGTRNICWKENPSRTPQGVRGLKPVITRPPGRRWGRTPQGVRGLKLCFVVNHGYSETVALRKECVD